MKLIDEKGRLLGKLSIFDLLILLLVIVGIVAIALRLVTPVEQPESGEKATFTVEFDGYGEAIKNAFKEGDTLYEEGVALGTVKSVAIEPYQSYELLPDGTVGAVEHQLTFSVTVVVETDRLRNDGGYRVASQEMLNGTSHIFTNGYAAFTGVVRELVPAA